MSARRGERRGDRVGPDRASGRRVGLATTLGIYDDALLDELVALGFDRDTIGALYLTPLVEVAWAEGSVTGAERDAVFEAARSIGIRPGSSSYAMLDRWLSSPPPVELVDRSLRALARVVAHSRADTREHVTRWLVGACAVVAEVSGPMARPGAADGPVVEEERRTIRKIAERLWTPAAVGQAPRSPTLL